MSYDAHSNGAYSTILTAPSPATSGTSLVVQSADGTRFPAVPFNATVWPAGAQPLFANGANAEIVRVTAVSTDTFTITRTQEGSSARSIVVGDQIVASITAKTLTDIETPFPNGAWISTFVPVITAGSGTFTTTTSSCRYQVYGKLVQYHVIITITTNGTAAGSVIFTLPITANAAVSGNWSIGSGREGAAIGNMVVVTAGSTTTGQIRSVTNTYPGGTGYVLYVSGTYEST